jgi:hypothetical protein
MESLQRQHDDTCQRSCREQAVALRAPLMVRIVSDMEDFSSPTHSEIYSAGHDRLAGPPVTINSFPAILRFLEFIVKVSLRARHESLSRV